jgi:hypothetical protein
MDPFQPIYPPGFRPTDGFGPGGFGPGPGPGNTDTPQTVQPQTVQPPQQTVQPPQQSQSQSPQTVSSMTTSINSAPTNSPNQPPVGRSSSTDVFNVPTSILSGGASITASSESSTTIVGFQSSNPISTLFNSASAPISTLFTSATGSGASVVTSIIALSTTTITGLPNASASAAKAAGGTEGLTSAIPEPVLKDQTIVGVAVGIGIWLLVIIAALSWCLWRKRKILRERGERLDDDATLMPPDMSDMEGIAGLAPARTTQRTMAPSVPPPAFLTRSISTADSMPGPLGSHPVSREGRVEMPSLSLFEYGDGRTIDAPPRSPSTLFPGAQRISQYSPRNSLSESIGETHRSLIKMRALSTGSERSATPDHVSELPPSLGKLNSWLEENRRRSRMTASSSVVGRGEKEIYNEREREPDEGRQRADSGTLGTPVLSRPGPGSRPMSLASLKDVYRRSATLDRSTVGNIKESEVLPSTPAK